VPGLSFSSGYGLDGEVQSSRRSILSVYQLGGFLRLAFVAFPEGIIHHTFTPDHGM